MKARELLKCINEDGYGAKQFIIKTYKGIAKTYALDYLDYKMKNKSMHVTEPEIEDYGIREIQAKLIRQRVDAKIEQDRSVRK